MKKFFLAMLTILSFFASTYAQISLTSANAPKAGTSVRTRSLSEDSLFTFNIGLAGANLVWNYAAFKFDFAAAQQTNYVQPSQTTFGSDPAINKATFAEFNIEAPERVNFDSVSTANWWLIGAADSAGVRRQTPIIRKLNFPWTFNSAFSDSFDQIIVDPTTGDTILLPSVNAAKCDAYGSITTAIGTFNCLRVTRLNKEDLELAPGVGLYLKITTTEWWTTQHPQPVFSYARLDLDFFGDKDSFAIVSSLVQTRVANDEIAKIDLKTYPNPAQNTVNLDFETPDNQMIVLTVFNLSGQVMHSDKFEAVQGKQQRTVDVSNLPNGIYMVHLAGLKSKHLGLRKIVVQR
jgi:Secretion system C-terminal sorting domain